MTQESSEVPERARLVAEIHLEEFKALRSEINMTLDELTKLVNIYIISLGIVITATFSEFGHSLLPTIVALATPLFAVTWVRKNNTIRRIGVYIGNHLRTELMEITGSRMIFGWEPYITRVNKDRVESILYRLIPLAMFLLPALVTGLAPAIFLEITFDPASKTTDLRAAAWSIFACAALLNFAWTAYWLFFSSDPYDQYPSESRANPR